MTKMLAPIDVVCVASWNADLVSQLERPPIRGETLLAQRASTPAPGKTLPQLLEQLDAGECKGIKSATAYKIAEFAREQGYLE